VKGGFLLCQSHNFLMLGLEHCHLQPTAKPSQLIQPSLLLSLLEQPSYGYELIERLANFKFHAGTPDSGTIYRNLRRLEKDGYVESSWQAGEAGPAKRVYAITPKGVALLKKWAEELAQRRSALDNFIGKYQELTKDELSEVLPK